MDIYNNPNQGNVNSFLNLRSGTLMFVNLRNAPQAWNIKKIKQIDRMEWNSMVFIPFHFITHFQFSSLQFGGNEME